uniref:C2H2-type domain-containing protein n=1 Tax=Seriola dumerili TaxID=41447 RepID=A0A3B4U296_SERDU
MRGICFVEHTQLERPLCRMATLQSFNVFLMERLTAAAIDIYGFVEKTVANYEEEVYRTKRENQRLQRLLDLVYKPEIRLHRADAKQPTLPTSAEDISPKQQDRCPSVHVGESAPSHMKEEKVHLLINGFKEEPSAENRDDGDALTKELIETVQQSEGCTPAEESREPKQTTEEGRSKKKTNTTLYSCQMCNCLFTKRILLTRHLKTHKSRSSDGSRKFDGELIPDHGNLRNNMKVHKGKRPYSCTHCNKCFKVKGHMIEHIRTHTGEKPFRCHVCGHAFNRDRMLKKHILTKHKDERPYKCGDCDVSFTERQSMKLHVCKVNGVKSNTSQSVA